jgi:hypothetical protein
VSALDLQARGRLSQRCPCGVTEAAGAYCTSCRRAMGPADWGVDDRKTRPEGSVVPPSGAEGPDDGSLDPDAPQKGNDRAAA